MNILSYLAARGIISATKKVVAQPALDHNDDVKTSQLDLDAAMWQHVFVFAVAIGAGVVVLMLLPALGVLTVPLAVITIVFVGGRMAKRRSW